MTQISLGNDHKAGLIGKIRWEYDHLINPTRGIVRQTADEFTLAGIEKELVFKHMSRCVGGKDWKLIIKDARKKRVMGL